MSFYKKPEFVTSFCNRCKDSCLDLDYHDIVCSQCQCYVPCFRDKNRERIEGPKYHDLECTKSKASRGNRIKARG